MFKSLKKFFTAEESVPVQSLAAAPEEQRELLSQWGSIEVDGHRVDLFEPAGVGQLAGCVLFLHGHGRVMLNSNRVFTELFQKYQLAAICPDGGRSWWLDRICAEFDPLMSPQKWILERLVPFIEDHLKIAPPKIALLGVSMGGQGALQLAYRKASLFPVVAAIAPAVDFQQMYGQGLPIDSMFRDFEDARQATAVLNLHPLAWPRRQFFCCDPKDAEWFEGCARLGMKLSSSGILHDRDLETTVDGHTWNYFNHMAPAVMERISRSLAEFQDGVMPAGSRPGKT